MCDLVKTMFTRIFQDRIVIKRAQVPTFVPFHEYEVASDVKAFKAVNDIFSFGPNPETSGTGGMFLVFLINMGSIFEFC